MVGQLVDFLKVSQFGDDNGAFGSFVFNLLVIKLAIRGFIGQQVFLIINSTDTIFNNVVDDHLKLLIIAGFGFGFKSEPGQYFFDSLFFAVMFLRLVFIVKLKRRVGFDFFRCFCVLLVNIVGINFMNYLFLR
jgi:hypothetical protein